MQEVKREIRKGRLNQIPLAAIKNIVKRIQQYQINEKVIKNNHKLHHYLKTFSSENLWLPVIGK